MEGKRLVCVCEAWYMMDGGRCVQVICVHCLAHDRHKRRNHRIGGKVVSIHFSAV